MSKLNKLVFVFVSFFLTAHAIAQTHTLVQGWNLEGNDNGAAVDPNIVFGNATAPTSISPSVTTVWAWDKNALQWNFFAPGMTPAALATYAASKGYGVLTTIPQGQGFWVNAKNAASFISTQAVAQTHTLVQGWNLEGNDNSAAVDPNVIFGNATTPTSISPSVTTVWAWDKNALQWNFFAPGMTPAALATYAASKGYGVLTTIPQGQGFWVNAKNAASVGLSAQPAAAAISKLNDTGITASQCYQAGSDVLVACNSAGAIALNNAQDGMVGRDANVATNSNADGMLGFSFTSVPAAGIDTGGCVQDNVTGLMWEVKTADGGLRDRSKGYTNYDSSTELQKWNGSSYVAPTQAEIDAPTNSVGFKNSVNVQGLCGHSDWRLPTADELQSIVNYSIVNYNVVPPVPTIDATWFPNTQDTFWSASPYVGVSGDAWAVDFGSTSGGVGNGGGRGVSFYVRLVRAGQLPITPRYTVSADGQEVTDNQTNLIWRRCPEGMTFSGGTCTGVASTFTHELALQRAATQASSTGVAWRLPNIKELSSIADKSLRGPAIDSVAFPVTPSGVFWSASPYVGYSSYAWFVIFDYGSVNGSNGAVRNYSGYVRLVRAGQ